MKSIQEQLIEQRELLIESKSDEIAQAIKEGNVDEGFFASVIGGLAGVTLGASIMKAVCKALGITAGPLYNLLTSKLICGVAGAAIGNNWGK